MTNRPERPKERKRETAGSTQTGKLETEMERMCSRSMRHGSREGKIICKHNRAEPSQKIQSLLVCQLPHVCTRPLPRFPLIASSKWFLKKQAGQRVSNEIGILCYA